MKETLQEKYIARHFSLDFRFGNIVLFSKKLYFLVSDQHLHYRRKGNNLEELKQFKGRDVNGVMFWFYPIEEKMPTISIRHGFICYLENRGRHFFLKIKNDFEQYQKETISKISLSTIRYEVRHYDKYFNPHSNFREYRTVEEIMEFLPMARKIAKKTWQERVLQAGFLSERNEKREYLELAGKGQVRGYLLFAGEKAIAFATCIIEKEDVIIYRKIGFDPVYRKWSPGTVLFYKMLERLFAENRFTLLDFMGGEMEHKRKYANDFIYCADIYCFKKNFVNLFIVLLHRGLVLISTALKWLTERMGIRKKIKKIIKKKFPPVCQIN